MEINPNSSPELVTVKSGRSSFTSKFLIGPVFDRFPFAEKREGFWHCEFDRLNFFDRSFVKPFEILFCFFNMGFFHAFLATRPINDGAKKYTSNPTAAILAIDEVVLR